jgi:hypothetical protein
MVLLMVQDVALVEFQERVKAWPVVPSEVVVLVDCESELVVAVIEFAQILPFHELPAAQLAVTVFVSSWVLPFFRLKTVCG